MEDSFLIFVRLEEFGKRSSLVEARLLRFWEARNVKRGGELMWVDILLLDVNATMMKATINASRLSNIVGGGPVPVQVKTGESSSDAEKSANANAAGDAPKKRRTHRPRRPRKHVLLDIEHQ
ncbi:hypothetical protein Bca52824_002222 [Brassica carinata]|uniref:Uncharacterized protein n=1 Tax=Brassica carinata TaxID=52824 RepID=A0A8X8BDR7_BRACI|nr:hypothetical protein Bca52824_002222 [Brassica carinata]